MKHTTVNKIPSFNNVGWLKETFIFIGNLTFFNSSSLTWLLTKISCAVKVASFLVAALFSDAPSLAIDFTIKL